MNGQQLPRNTPRIPLDEIAVEGQQRQIVHRTTTAGQLKIISTRSKPTVDHVHAAAINHD